MQIIITCRRESYTTPDVNEPGGISKYTLHKDVYLINMDPSRKGANRGGMCYTLQKESREN